MTKNNKKKIDKNALVQRYLEKTNCSHWNKDDDDNRESTETIGLPSLEFLYEIQKSISYKLAQKYKYVPKSNDIEGEEEEQEEEEEQYEQQEEEVYEEGDHDEYIEEEQQEEEEEEEEVIDNEKIKKSKKVKKTKILTRSINSGQLKTNSKDSSINRFPLSEPCFRVENYNERCGPEILMSLGVLHQQILISQIKSLNFYQPTKQQQQKEQQQQQQQKVKGKK